MSYGITWELFLPSDTKIAQYCVEIYKCNINTIIAYYLCYFKWLPVGGKLCYLNNPEFLNSFHFLWALETLPEYLHLKLLNSFSEEPLVFGCKLEFILPNTSTDIYILKELYLGLDMLKKESLLGKKKKKETPLKRNRLRASLKTCIIQQVLVCLKKLLYKLLK